MRYDSAFLHVQDETAVALNTAICVWPRHWRHLGFKGSLFLRWRDATVDMPFVKCFQRHRYAEPLATNIAVIGDRDAVPSAFVALFFFSILYHHPWFIYGMDFCWCDEDLSCIVVPKSNVVSSVPGIAPMFLSYYILLVPNISFPF